MKSFCWLFCAAISVFLFAGSAGAEDQSMYRIKPGDQLNIYVHQNADLTLIAPVLPDGTISYPLVGNLYVQGLTTAGLQNVMTEKLGQYLQSPVVVVSISSQTAYKVYIMGEVGNPGAYPYNQEFRLTDYLAIAGGTKTEANLEKCFIFSKGENAVQQVVNLKDIYGKNEQELNITLTPDDTIMIERRSGFLISEWFEIAQIFSVIVASATLYLIFTRE